MGNSLSDPINLTMVNAIQGVVEEEEEQEAYERRRRRRRDANEHRERGFGP